MGLGGQLTLWPDEFVDALNTRGFRTIRYDNRDVGLSTRFEAAGVPNIKWMFVKAAIGLPVRPAYTLADHERKSVVQGKSVSVRVDLGGRRIIKKKKK